MTARLTSIVAIDRNGAIGCRNALPWKLKSDMAFFRSTTVGQTVVMGRKTYDSIGCALVHRRNVVLSHNATLFPSTPECQLVGSVDEALVRADKNRSREVLVIGGAATYSEFAPLVDRYLVTFVDHVADDADAFIAPDILDEIRGWDSREIATHSASPGRDDYGFKILEFEAPDADERAKHRQRIVAAYVMKSHKAAATHSRPQTGSASTMQEAFAF
jgi:dihydrofolate reductase